jgi:16S rRNA (cytosine967-C5)-methyltransferase
MEKVAEIVENDNLYEFKPNARQLCVKILNRYDRSDSYIDKLVHQALKIEQLIPQDKALLTELVNGVIRWRSKLDWVLTGFYHGDYQKCLNLVKNAMRIALYQIMYLNRIPVPAAIYESVEIVKRIQGDKTAAIVNGVLRNIARNLDNIRYPERNEDETYYYAILHSHPKWMVKRWIERYGIENTEKLMCFNNQRPYIAVRVNTLKVNIEEIKSIFTQHNIAYRQCPYLIESLLLDSPKYDVSASELFRSGKIAIQDPSASLAARLANPQAGDLVIDLCAAPGGKSFLLAELMINSGKIIALDKHQSKLRFITEGALRLGLDIIEVSEADASEFKINQKADIVFADVPCSGMGTISKKPDIKWKRELDDITMLVQMQRQILANAARLVKINGAIIYSTCTIEPEENKKNVEWFLANNPDFELDNAEKYLPAEVCSDGYFESIPYIHAMDGAFAARFIKKR